MKQQWQWLREHLRMFLTLQFTRRTCCGSSNVWTTTWTRRSQRRSTTTPGKPSPSPRESSWTATASPWPTATCCPNCTSSGWGCRRAAQHHTATLLSSRWAGYLFYNCIRLLLPCHCTRLLHYGIMLLFNALYLHNTWLVFKLLIRG